MTAPPPRRSRAAAEPYLELLVRDNIRRAIPQKKVYTERTSHFARALCLYLFSREGVQNMRPKHLVAILVLLALAVPASPAHAGGIVSICDEAHLLAALAGGGTVTFSCSGTITLTAEITIAADTTIDGSGQAVTISGNNAVRVFTVNSGVTVNLNRLTVADGCCRRLRQRRRHLNRGTLTVSNSTFSGNSAAYGGGGIDNDGGTLTVSNSTFSGNSAPTAWRRHHQHYYGMLTVSNSTFIDNSRRWRSWRRHLQRRRHADREQQHLLRQLAPATSAAVSVMKGGTLTVSNSTFSDNNAAFGGLGGGGILNFGTLTVSNSTFSGNSAFNSGGGI